MLIPVGRQYTTTSFASVIKQVRCEECGRRYEYELRRAAKGGSLSPLFLDNEGAKEASEERSQRSLRKKLANECDLVPCPRCGHKQAYMVVATVRSRAKRGEVVSGAILVILGAIWFIHGSLDAGGGLRFDWMAWAMLADLLVMMYIAAGMPAAMEDPAKHWPPERVVERPVAISEPVERPTDLAEEVPPLMESEVRVSENAAAVREEPVIGHLAANHWIPIHPSLLDFPALCCVCAAPAEKSRRGKVGGVTFKVPVCANCAKSMQGSRTLIGAVTFLGTAGVMALVFASGKHTPVAGIVFGSSTIAAMGTLILDGAYLQFQGLPLRFRNVDPGRDYAEVQFDNIAFAETFVASQYMTRQAGHAAGA